MKICQNMSGFSWILQLFAAGSSLQWIRSPITGRKLSCIHKDFRVGTPSNAGLQRVTLCAYAGLCGAMRGYAVLCEPAKIWCPYAACNAASSRCFKPFWGSQVTEKFFFVSALPTCRKPQIFRDDDRETDRDVGNVWQTSSSTLQQLHFLSM